MVSTIISNFYIDAESTGLPIQKKTLRQEAFLFPRVVDAEIYQIPDENLSEILNSSIDGMMDASKELDKYSKWLLNINSEEPINRSYRGFDLDDMKKEICEVFSSTIQYKRISANPFDYNQLKARNNLAGLKTQYFEARFTERYDWNTNHASGIKARISGLPGKAGANNVVELSLKPATRPCGLISSHYETIEQKLIDSITGCGFLVQNIRNSRRR